MYYCLNLNMIDWFFSFLFGISFQILRNFRFSKCSFDVCWKELEKNDPLSFVAKKREFFSRKYLWKRFIQDRYRSKTLSLSSHVSSSGSRESGAPTAASVKRWAARGERFVFLKWNRSPFCLFGKQWNPLEKRGKRKFFNQKTIVFPRQELPYHFLTRVEP